VCPRPTDCPGTSTRTSRNLPTHALLWPIPKLAGAQAPAAPAAGLRRAARRRSLSPQNRTQAGPPRPLEPSPGLPGRGRRRGRRNWLTCAGQPRPGATLQSQQSFQGPCCKRLTQIVKPIGCFL
jgi:hypothetical protein